MKIKLKVEKEFDIKTLYVIVDSPYWEDFEINGEESEEGENVPCKVDNTWRPIIEIETGFIINWDKGKRAAIHSKVRDSGTYKLFDEKGDEIISLDGEYVPDTLCPKDNGYGDYIIMNVNEDGQIDGWKFNIKDFTREED